jgi:hypothetical protein
VRQVAGRIQAIGGWVFTAGVLLNIFFAGLLQFGAAGAGLHISVGYLLTLLALVLLVLGAVAGRAVATSGLLVLFSIAQILLVWASEAAPVVAALHPVNALVLMYLGHAVGRGLGVPVGRRAAGAGSGRVS